MQDPNNWTSSSKNLAEEMLWGLTDQLYNQYHGIEVSIYENIPFNGKPYTIETTFHRGTRIYKITVYEGADNRGVKIAKNEWDTTGIDNEDLPKQNWLLKSIEEYFNVAIEWPKK